jgi:hypothetical protein
LAQIGYFRSTSKGALGKSEIPEHRSVEASFEAGKIMQEVVVLAEAAEDLERGRQYYEGREEGIGQYFIDCIISDIESLALFHGTHRIQHGCLRMLSRRFPFGIYYLESHNQTQVVAILDLRRRPSWIRNELRMRGFGE